MPIKTQSYSEQTNEITINIHLSRQLAVVLVVALLAIAAIALMTWDSKPAAASDAHAPAAAVNSSTGMRKFYLTTASYNGSAADGNDGNGGGVCEPGYHFASIWEILDVSNLEYDGNPIYADTREDSGDGPPTVTIGWVRTGYNGTDDTNNIPGEANCSGWDTNNASYKGTIASLSSDWSNPADHNFDIWNISLGVCSSEIHVWCVED